MTFQLLDPVTNARRQATFPELKELAALSDHEEKQVMEMIPGEEMRMYEQLTIIRLS